LAFGAITPAAVVNGVATLKGWWQCGGAGVVCSPARGAGCARPRPWPRSEREEGQIVILARGEDQRPWVVFEAESHGLAVTPRTLGSDSRSASLGRRLKLEVLSFDNASRPEVSLMFGHQPSRSQARRPRWLRDVCVRRHLPACVEARGDMHADALRRRDREPVARQTRSVRSRTPAPPWRRSDVSEPHGLYRGDSSAAGACACCP
jgi:hypothetical protein